MLAFGADDDAGDGGLGFGALVLELRPRGAPERGLGGASIGLGGLDVDPLGPFGDIGEHRDGVAGHLGELSLPTEGALAHDLPVRQLTGSAARTKSGKLTLARYRSKRPTKGEGATMRVGILGSGLMGGKLGTIFARAGHEVVFSYAHSGQKLKKLARDAKGKASPGTPREAVQDADAVLLAVHWSRIDDVLNQAGDLSGKVIVSCSLPMNDDNTELVVAHSWSGAEELAKMLPKTRVVSAFGTVPSEVLFGVYEARRKTRRPSLVYCGDSRKAKALAAELIRDAGFDPTDAGPLEIARYTEPFALLIAQLAYEGKSSPALAYRFERLAD